jgi:hypothetical protein
MADKPIQIVREQDRPAAFDYAKLRTEGLAAVQRLSGHIWTDYNLHDPGVTMLENLCFAITDLAYKTDFPIAELLAEKDGRINAAAHAFFGKGDILSSAPVTVADYRKLVLDQVANVENIWIEPLQSAYSNGVEKGIYRVLIQPADAIAGKGISSEIDQVVTDVRQCLARYRNLGENFEELKVLKPQFIAIKAEIMVDDVHSVKEIVAYICNAIEQVVHPPVRFVSEGELLAAGYTTEDIYAGPLLSRGFVQTSDLKDRKTQLDPAELIKAISLVDGVQQVKYLQLSMDGVHYSNKPIAINSDSYPFVNIEDERNDIGIYSNQFEHHFKDAVFWTVYEKIREVRKRHYTAQQRGLVDKSLDAPYRNLAAYYSIQHYFPTIYGIGREGIFKSESDERKAQVKQLKAYLMFFEQLLADYLAQLSNLSGFFSGNSTQTYFTQPLYTVPNVEELIKAFTDSGQTWDTFKADPNNAYVQALQQVAEPVEVFRQRKINVLNHLLARFNMTLHRYPVTLYERLYVDASDEDKLNSEIRWKADVLDHLPGLTGTRIQSINYLQDTSIAGVYSGYQQWMLKLLHMSYDGRQRLTAVFDGGQVNMQSAPRWQPYTETKSVPHDNETLRVKDESVMEGHYQFGHQPVSVLRYGVDTANYRIVSADDEYLILYKEPSQQQWQKVAQYKDRQSSLNGLQEMVQHLRNISLQSEGFYLVEHTLLKPLFNTGSFGFRLLAADRQVLIEQRYFNTFSEREELLSKLMNGPWLELAPVDMFNQLSQWCRIYIPGAGVLTIADFTQDKERAEQTMYNLALNLQQLQKEKRAYYPRMDYQVKLSDGRIQPESFFRFGLTVVLPSWPARFQFQEFRHFTEELFRENTPVHFNIRFRWLGVADMRRFEDAYYPFLGDLKNYVTFGDTPSTAAKLLDFLL